MHANYNGNVGIGSTSPAYKLDVSGTGRFTGDLTVGTVVGTANSATLYANPSSYGSWKIGGTRNGWYGIEFESGTNLMANSNEVGFHRNGSGWQMRWSAGVGYVYKGNPGGGTEAVILDSSNSPYANNMNQYVRTTDSPTFVGLSLTSVSTTGATITNLTGAYQNTTVYDSAKTQSATPSRGIRAPASSIQFTDSYAIAPYYTYRSTGDWPVPYGIGWGTGGESSGIFQRYASNGSSFGDMIFYTGNDGFGAFSFRRHRDKPWTLPLFLKNKMISPLKLLFKSRVILFGIINYVSTLIMTNKINLNKLPYVGFIFIYIDYLIINLLQKIDFIFR